MGHLITETTETGALIKDYIWNEMHPVAQIDAVIPAQAGIQPIETITYLYTDHLMTSRLATSQSKTIIWRWEGEAFGNTPAQKLSGVSINLRFPGQYYDSETNLHYNHFRYYDPSLGRYITSDPLGITAGNNTYTYVDTNPITNDDPLGLLIRGKWTNGSPRLTQGDINYQGWDYTLGVDWFGYLLLVKTYWNVSGSIVASVKCIDEETCNEWEVSHYIPISVDGDVDLGPNLVATAIGIRTGNFLYALAANIAIAAAKGAYGVGKIYNKYGQTASLTMSVLRSTGPDHICNYGLPTLPSF